MKVNMDEVRDRYYKLFKLLPPSVEKIANEKLDSFQLIRKPNFYKPSSLKTAIFMAFCTHEDENVVNMFADIIEDLEAGWHFLPNDLPEQSLVVEVALVHKGTCWSQHAYMETDGNKVSFKFDNTDIEMLENVNAIAYAWRAVKEDKIPKYYE